MRVLSDVRPSPSDPFAKVRAQGGALVVLLGLRAGMRVIDYVVGKLTFPPSGSTLTEEQIDRIRMIDGGLYGLENLVTLVAMILFLVWIHGLFVAIRASGRRTRWSPAMAVGGWFIPLGNVVLPWLTVRDALRSLDRPTALAGAWWIAWLLAIPLTMLHGFLTQVSLVPEFARALEVLPAETLRTIYELGPKTFWPRFVLDTGAWALLLVIVTSLRAAVSSRR